jgi:hypothetical protein
MVASVIGVVLGPEASENGEFSIELAVGWALQWGGAWVEGVDLLLEQKFRAGRKGQQKWVESSE